MEQQTKNRLTEIGCYTTCYLKAVKPFSEENYSIVKLYINNYDNCDENGIVIGYWKELHNDRWQFIPVTPSHWELVSDLFYLKGNKQIPREINDTREVNVMMETLTIKK